MNELISSDSYIKKKLFYLFYPNVYYVIPITSYNLNHRSDMRYITKRFEKYKSSQLLLKPILIKC